MADQDYYSSINGPYTSTMSSNFLLWKPFHAKTGLCLEFLYHMPNPSAATLSVYVETIDRKVMVWSMTGYQGDQWNEGRIAWDGKRKSKVYFEGIGVLNGSVNIAITNVKITTQSCALSPTYAKPGFRCKVDEFQCHNKRCIKSSSRCDGDISCIDGSDEKDCLCPSDTFSCPSGECISTATLCDNLRDCKDGTDELNCDVECKGMFQCVDGSCIPWSSTCKKQRNYCPDSSHNPTICGNGNCRLNKIGCALKTKDIEADKMAVYRSFTVPCSFENGFCGFALDRQADFLWSLGSGSTPSEGTGPKFDHTTLSPKGRYIYIEASGRKAREKAGVISGWLNANETLCLQFWYHMYGKDIGTLAVVLKSNQFEKVIWQKEGSFEEKWMFAQTTLRHKEKYKFVLEGTTTGGKNGDVALDDIMLFDGECNTIHSQSSPDCYFEANKCGWKSDDGWRVHKGNLLMLLSSKNVQTQNISSLEINANKYRWKCLQFWYLIIGQSSTLTVSTKSLENQHQRLMTLRKASKGGLNLMQLQIPDEKELKIIFTGNIPQGSFDYIYLDDISFSDMKCLMILSQNDKHEGINCSCSDDWCCWTKKYNGSSNNTWSIISRRKLYNYRKEKSITSPDVKYDDQDFEVMLLPNTSLSVSDVPPFKTFSLCFWLRTSERDFYVKYQFQWQAEKTSTGLRIILADSINVTIGNSNFSISGNGSRLFRNDWHFYCFVWSGNQFSVYIDGVEVNKEYILNQHETSIPGGGILTIGYALSDPNTNQTKAGTLGNFNIWDYKISSNEVKRMSYGCGTKEGNVVSWKSFLTRDKRIIRKPATCKDIKDTVLAVTGLSLSNLLSPVYFKSTTHSHKCFKLRYMMYGPGVHSFQIRLVSSNETSAKLIWTDRDNSKAEWRYGQVPVTALNAFQVLLQGHITEKPGYIALGSAYVEDASCDHLPDKAKEAFSDNISKGPGFISSPYYPGNYIRNIHCHWQITAPANHVIRLTFQDFMIEDHDACSADYVEVLDGDRRAEKSLGKFCGYIYPQFLESSSSHMTVIFHSNKEKERRGFKAYYSFLEGRRVLRAGCPTGCKCSLVDIKAKNGKQTFRKILVEGSQGLYEIPEKNPKETGALMLQRNRISKIKENSFAYLPHLLHLDVSNNNIFDIGNDSFANMTSTEIIRMHSNLIRTLPLLLFRHLRSLRILDLGKNLLGRLHKDVFIGLEGLNVLSLRANGIKRLPSTLFYNTTNLTHLYLQDNLIKTIPSGMFRHQKVLKILLLHRNNIKHFDKLSFEGLGMLRTLKIEKNQIDENVIPRDAFENLVNLEYLSTDSFILCCYAMKSIPYLTCESPVNEFSSCESMLKNRFVELCVWVQGVIAIIANLGVIAWWTFMAIGKPKFKTKRKTNSVQTLFISHLAFADFLMGVYLLFIGSYDQVWKGEYFVHDVQWRAGLKCQIAGAISTLSREVSVMILVAITADRMNTIIFQFSGKRTNLKVAHTICLCIWIIGFVISFAPLFAPSYFNDRESGFSFYGRSTVCMPLQLTADRPTGWEYSVGIFIGFNGASFLFILVGYIAIFIKVRRSGRKVRSSKSAESSLGKRVFFVILTDFCCWMPIVVLGVLSLNFRFYIPSVYIWAAGFVLSINSTINPILYTFSSSQTINNIKSLRKKLFKDKVMIPVEGKNPVTRRQLVQNIPTAAPLTLIKRNDEGAMNKTETDDPGDKRQMLVAVECHAVKRDETHEKN